VSFLKEQAEGERTQVGVVIEDEGIGLSEADLARVGERFFRADKSGNVPGTGLGLSIVKELMTLMGGRMEITSQLGRGTTVRLWL
jgi:signal transduction histidine kinase